VAFDVVSEVRIQAGTLHGAWASIHGLVDHVLPLVAGVLLGIAAHYMRIRTRLAEAEAAAGRADALRIRLQKVERDQAVWVLAAAVLHEVNNPLHAIGLALDELNASQGNPQLVADLVARARAQSDRALSKLKALRSMRGVGEPALEFIPLHDVLGRIAHDLAALAHEEGLDVNLECGGPVRVIADPEYVRTIVENLVDNGLQVLRERGGRAVVISVDVADTRAVVRVADDGPIRAPPLDDSIFEPLRSTKQRGLGLGLAISRALARSMRGDLLLDAEPRRGLRLELPMERPA
jgi:signal transduction histidine kinase